MSGLIPENNVARTSSESQTIMYADEFGVLRYAENNLELDQTKHSPVLPNSEISLSNLIINFNDTESFNYTNDIARVGVKHFAHSYYVSRYFTIQTSNLGSTMDLSSLKPIVRPEQIGVFVVDESGNPYVDSEGKNKYQICLQRYGQILNPSSNQNFYRIIVILPDADPQGLSLVYNKFETTSDGLPFNQFLGYKEYINAVPYYDYVVEESEVVDPLSDGRLIYSTQLVSQKENQLVKHKIDKPGWKAYVPRKAIQDPRTFQSFNWRLVSKINSSYSYERNIYSEDQRPEVYAAVLTSAGQRNEKYPYVFHNLENYVTNLQNLLITNPGADTEDKTSSDYWLVSINDEKLFQYDYDILYWHIDSVITQREYQIISTLVEKGTSVFIDCSSVLGRSSFSNSLNLFGISYSITKTGNNEKIKIQELYKNSESATNKWNIEDFEETDTIKPYGVFGFRRNPISGEVYQYKTFDTSSDWNNAKRLSVVYTNENKTILLRKTYNVDDNSGSNVARKGNIFFSSVPISYLLNNPVSQNVIQSYPENNESSNIINFSQPQNRTVISPAIEGPIKLFYNIIANNFRNKVISNKETGSESSIVWHLSPWKPSWTINGERTNGQVTVLTEQEKTLYNFSDKTEAAQDLSAGSAQTFFCRELVPAMTSYLTNQLLNSTTQASLINSDFSNVEFYVETTNGNVGFLNFTSISDDDVFYGESGSPYTVYKITDAALQQIRSLSTSPICAYSKVESAEFDQSTIGYPYMLIDNYEYNYDSDTNNSFNREDTKDTQQTLDYSFGLSTKYTYKDIEEQGSKYRINWKIGIKAKLSGSGTIQTKDLVDDQVERTLSISKIKDNPLIITDSESSFKGFSYSTKIFSATDLLAIGTRDTSLINNNFHYTGDIELSKRWDEYAALYVSRSGSVSSSSKTPGTGGVGGGNNSNTGSPTSPTPTPVSGDNGSNNPNSGNNSGGSPDGGSDGNVIIDPNYPTIDFSYKRGKKIEFSLDANGTAIDDYTYRTLLGGGLGNLRERLSEIWNSLVFYNASNDVKYFGSLITDWAYRFASAKLPQEASKSEYIASCSGIFLLKNFLNAYGDFYYVEFTKMTSQSVGNMTKNQAVKAVQSKVNKKQRTIIAVTENDFVKYVQYTLNKVLGAELFGKKIYPEFVNLTIDGQFGPKTQAAVLTFQTIKSQRYLDGIIDSETKSVLANYWINLKNTDIERYRSERAAAPAEVREYIFAANTYSNIAELGNQEYRRIAFTGVAGPPGRIEDYLILKTPEKAEKLKGITVLAGGWNVRVTNVWTCEKELIVNGKHIVPFFKKEYPIKQVWRTMNGAGRLMKAGGTVEDTPRINFDTEIPNVKYVIIKVVGDPLPANPYGPYAEGFSIKDIKFHYLTTKKVEVTETFEDTKLTGEATGWIEGYTDLRPAYDNEKINFNKSIKDILNDRFIKVNKIYFEDVYAITNKEDVIGNLRHPIYNGSPAEPLTIYDSSLETARIKENETVSKEDALPKWSLKFDRKAKIVPDENTFSIEGAEKRSTPKQEYNSPFTGFQYAKQKTGVYVLSGPNSTQFSAQVVSQTTPITNYYIADADNRNNRRNNPQTVSARDGLVVLTNNLGQPIGFPNFAALQITDRNVQRNFGYINLLWTADTEEPFGLRWGFYNVSTKTFYGNRISYLDYIKDASNIYVGLLAYDADGDSSTSNIIGSNDFIISDNQLPNKLIAPLYSVKVAPKTKIGLYPPPDGLSKFDSWFVQVGVGKFFKNISVPQKVYSNFLSDHSGKTIRCLYDTTSFDATYSTIFGKGYYDVIEEQPEIISDTEIKLRHGSITVYKEQVGMLTLDGKYTDVAKITPWMYVYIKNSNNQWIQVRREKIDYYNKHDGTVRFKAGIVPSDPTRIKVTYTVKNGNNIIRHINGNEIPLNPFNSVNSDISRPIFVYLLPTKVEYQYNGTYVEDQDYSYNSEINWTTNYDVFNQEKDEYNPLALHIGTINVVNKYSFNNVRFNDLRVKGGGISAETNIPQLATENKNILSFADIRSGKGYTYPNGGYVIVRIPAEVKQYFTSVDDVYSIVRSNLTAGVSFDIQDLNGNDWRSI